MKVIIDLLKSNSYRRLTRYAKRLASIAQLAIQHVLSHAHIGTHNTEVHLYKVMGGGSGKVAEPRPTRDLSYHTHLLASTDRGMV